MMIPSRKQSTMIVRIARFKQERKTDNWLQYFLGKFKWMNTNQFKKVFEGNKMEWNYTNEKSPLAISKSVCTRQCVKQMYVVLVILTLKVGFLQQKLRNRVIKNSRCTFWNNENRNFRIVLNNAILNPCSSQLGDSPSTVSLVDAWTWEFLNSSNCKKNLWKDEEKRL